MRKRLIVVATGVAAVAGSVGLGLGAPTDSSAMTCVADPPISTVCDVGFGVLGFVCNGTPPKLPRLPVAGLSMTRPDLCPPLG
jgi:hypothetical protein